MKQKFTLLIALVLFVFSANAQELPTNWIGDTGIDIFKETTDFHGDAHSAKVAVNTGTQANCDFGNATIIPVTAGNTYTVKFWYKTSAHVYALAALDWAGSTSTTYPSTHATAGTTVWTEYTYSGTVPTGESSLTINIRFYDQTGFVAGEIQYIDDLTFESPTGTPITVTNGDLESWPVDNQAPVATFTPLNNATDVPISTNITIAFDEAVRNIDDSEITDLNVASLLTLKLTDAAGTDVPFTATIDASKRLITIDPDADLLNSQVYYVALAPVEDAAGNATATSDISFTTIAAATPVLTLTYPLGSETFDAGETVTFTWTSENMTTDEIQIDAQIYNGSTWEWIPIMAPTANDGTENFTIPADALYGTQYRIRITGTVNTTVTDESGDFTIIEVAADLAALRAKFTAPNYTATNVYKLTGEAVVSYYKTGSKENIYIQDNTAAIVLYDNLNAVSTVYNIGEGITGIYGNIPALYHGLLEFIPTADPGVASSTGNTITPQVVTPLQVTTSPDDYQAEKLKLNLVRFIETGVFAASTNYTITDGTNTIIFRPISAMIDQTIPTGLINLTAICGYYDNPQLFSLEMTDFEDAQDNTSIADESGLTQAAGDPISAGSTTPVEILRFNITDFFGDGLSTNVTSFTVKAGTGNTADWTTDINEGFFKDELGADIAVDGTNIEVFPSYVVVPIQTNGLIVPEGSAKTIVLTITTESTTADGVVIQAQVGGTEHGFTADILGSQFAADFAVVDGNARIVEHAGIVEQNSTGLTVYPNPSNGIFNINSQKNYSLEISDITGRTIKSLNIKENTTIELTNSGIYFLKFSDGINSFTQKVIVK